MTITLRPKGRGNWRPIVMRLASERVPPLTVRVGELLTLGGIVLRIVSVAP